MSVRDWPEPITNKETETMAQSLGTVEKLDDGNFEGILAMGLNTRITIVENQAKDTGSRQPDFRVYAGNHGEIGGAWNRIGKTSGKPFVSMTLAHPMIGNRKVYANLGKAHGGEDNQYAILWNPKD